MSGQRSGFDMSYSRRSAGMSNLEMHMQSILGAPPKRQQQPQQSMSQSQTFDTFGGRRMDGKGSVDYFDGSGRDDFITQQGVGGNVVQQQFQQQVRVPRDRDEVRQFGHSVTWTKRSPSPPRMRDGRGGMGGSDNTWSRSAFDDSQGISRSVMRGQTQGMQSLQMTPGANIGQSQDQQQVVMVVPQGNAGAGLMGMLPVQATPNPFIMQRQQPMQVILGNQNLLSGLNPSAFGGQQILTAASGRPNVMMGLMNQPQQGYDRSIVEGSSRRFSRQGSPRRSPGRSSTRRADHSSSSKSVGRGSTNTSSSAISRDRKRGILRDRHAPSGDSDRKRRRSSSRGRDRTGSKGKSSKDDKSKKKSDSKSEDKSKKDETKKGDDAEGKDDSKSKETEAKSEDKKGEGESVKTEDKEKSKEKEKKKSKYDEIPNAFLVCKICQKVMSDGDSFESHLNGRAHIALVKILEERFEKRGDLLMYESKLSEEEIGIEMQRQRRAGKSSGSGRGSKNYCTMCDSNYTVNWGTHKVSMWHRVLKEYLHPTCRCCNMNFVHRMDWVNHLYSLTHLRKLTELKEQGEDLTEEESCRPDEIFSINLEMGTDEHPTPVLLIRPTTYKIPTKEELKEMLKDEKGEVVIPEGDIEIPTDFVEDQACGEEAMEDIDGACCKVCQIFIAKRSDVEAHVKSKEHHSSYVAYLKKVVKCRENLKAEKEKAEKEAAEEAERLKKEEEAASAAAEAVIKVDVTENGNNVEEEHEEETENGNNVKEEQEEESENENNVKEEQEEETENENNVDEEQQEETEGETGEELAMSQ